MPFGYGIVESRVVVHSLSFDDPVSLRAELSMFLAPEGGEMSCLVPATRTQPGESARALWERPHRGERGGEHVMACAQHAVAKKDLSVSQNLPWGLTELRRPSAMPQRNGTFRKALLCAVRCSRPRPREYLLCEPTTAPSSPMCGVLFRGGCVHVTTMCPAPSADSHVVHKSYFNRL